MNKTEIKQCINETIVPNNEHGITAESLNLILNEMVDNSGEAGGNDDGIKNFVIYMDDMDVIPFESFTLDHYLNVVVPIIKEL